MNRTIIQEIFQRAAKLSLKEKSSKISTRNKKSSRCKKKWYDEECKKFREKTRSSAKLKNKNPLDLRVRWEHKNLLKSYKNLCRSKRDNFWKSQDHKLNSLISDNGAFWKSWSDIGENVKSNNITNADPNKWFQHFAGLFKKSIDRDSELPENKEDENQNSVINEPFTLDELRENIKKLKNNKSAGLDGIRNEMIKCSSNN